MFQQSLDNFKAAIEMSLGIAVLETLLASIIYLKFIVVFHVLYLSMNRIFVN